MFGLFGSSVIDEFKEKLEKVPEIKDILDDCRKSENVDKCFSYPIIDEELKKSIESILETSDPHVIELKKYIKEKTKKLLEKKAFMSAISKGKKRGVYSCVANYVINENNKIDENNKASDDVTARELREAAGNITLEDLDAIIEEKNKQDEAYKKYIEKQKTGDSSQPQGGGKSRRRHRRGRTLHKRRKSRKVRKTRCRRK
jgi:hypothetical protein